MKKPILLVLIVSWAFAGASASDKGVFGLILGDKLSIPECERQKIGKRYFYRLSSNALCFQHTSDPTKESRPAVRETVLIEFPPSEKPNLISGDAMLALVIDGRLEGVGFNTHGVADVETVLEALRKKYGEPTQRHNYQVQNRLGAKFDAIAAVWDLPDLFVQYQSVATSLDSGLVNIDTRKGHQHREEALKALTKDKRPL